MKEKRLSRLQGFRESDATITQPSARPLKQASPSLKILFDLYNIEVCFKKELFEKSEKFLCFKRWQLGKPDLNQIRVWCVPKNGLIVY